MKSYVMTWDEAIEIAPDLRKFLYCDICQDLFVEIVDCLNKNLCPPNSNRVVVSGFGLAPKSVDSPESKYPYFIILES